MSTLHFGRSWVGTPLEDDCPCPQEPCGLIATPRSECDQHPPEHARTMRQIHTADQCSANLAAEAPKGAGQ